MLTAAQTYSKVRGNQLGQIDLGIKCRIIKAFKLSRLGGLMNSVRPEVKTSANFDEGVFGRSFGGRQGVSS